MVKTFCPLTNGNVVYAARNLNNYLTHTTNAFTNSCGENTNSRGANNGNEFIRLKQPTAKPIVANSNCKLYPTVASKFVSIESKAPIKKIEIINVLGKIELVKTFADNSCKQTLDINTLISNTYFIRITDAQGSITIHKIVKS